MKERNKKEGRKIELFPQFFPEVLITAFVCYTAISLGNFVSMSAMEQEPTTWHSPKAPVAVWVQPASCGLVRNDNNLHKDHSCWN